MLDMARTRKLTQHIYLRAEPRELCFSFLKGEYLLNNQA
jgi:hypothetical protein